MTMVRTISKPLRLVMAGVAIAFAGVGIVSSQPKALAPAAKFDWRYNKYQSDPELHAIALKYFPSDSVDTAPTRIFRLTRDQIDTTVKGILPAYYKTSIKAAMPRDPLQTNYEYAEVLNFNAANFGALSSWIGDIAARVKKKPEGVVNCAGQRNAPDCLAAAARRFIVKAFRGDVDAAQMKKITAFYLERVKATGFAQATGDLVEVVLNSPNFLFRKELDVAKNTRLTPPQLLQSLSYTIADAPPEKLGLLSPEAGKYLERVDDARDTIGAMVSSQDARRKLMRFFSAWLEIREPEEFTISRMIFPDFTPKLAAAMVDETRRFLLSELNKPQPTLKDITQATQSLVPAAMRPVYGLNMSTPDATLVKHDPSKRLGIFTQPAVLASHSGPTDTRPIKRGVFWVRKVLCMEMGGVPPGLDSTLRKKSKHLTERKRIELSTRRGACAGCHKLINPLGFFQESFDALGRWRTEDNGLPVDSSVDIDFLDEPASKAAGPVEALQTLTNSMMFKQCFVRQVFRFYMGRNELPSDDPLLRRMFFEFAKDDSQDIFKLIQMLTASQYRIVARR